MLSNEVSSAQRLVRTDAYQMSIGEIVNMYSNGEIIIDPEFQRLFRWDTGQKSRLIESLLLGIPLPSIFVYEKEDGKWELIDGLQRISTILEFMGLLKSPNGALQVPSILDATKYLPSLHNVVWEESELIDGAPINEQVPLDKAYQLTIRRSRLSVEILKRPSDNKTKYDLFQRLNAGGTQANAQELRNCIMLMVDSINYKKIKTSAERASFLTVVDLGDDQIEKQRHMELAVRFLVHANIDYDGKLDIEEYMDDGVVQLMASDALSATLNVMDQTFDLLCETFGKNALKKYDGASHVGKVGLVGLEGVAVGVGKNLHNIKETADAKSFIDQRVKDFWQQPQVSDFTSPGMRGTTRIQRTVPFGTQWFHP